MKVEEAQSLHLHHIQSAVSQWGIPYILPYSPDTGYVGQDTGSNRSSLSSTYLQQLICYGDVFAWLCTCALYNWESIRKQRCAVCSNGIEHVHAHQRRVDNEGPSQKLVQPVQVALRVRDKRLQRL